ncbi:MAG: RNA-binding protein [candidate division WOR-3 bacterium]|nr:RNA-binding protein [candidate division WOR-3 bacterium]MCX7837484.1 RNA-binding protein [candidate division WOR-3 bacterium]
MSKTLYVGNVAYNVTEEMLNNLFSQYGRVISVKIIVDKFTNRPRGFAFVEMNNDEEANNAISGLNGKNLEGRNLVVAEARSPKERRTQRGRSPKGGRRFRRF